MKSVLKVLILVVLMNVSFKLSFAEEYTPATELYSIDVPEDWDIRDNDNTEYSVVYVVNPEGTNGMKIATSPSIVEEDETLEDYLTRRIEHMAEKTKAQEEGKVHQVEAIEIDGIPAKHMDFEMMTSTGKQQGSQTIFIHNDSQYMITYGSADKKEKSQMDEVAKTFRVQRSSLMPGLKIDESINQSLV